MKELFYRFITLGEKPAMSPLEKRRLHIINGGGLLGVTTSLLYMAVLSLLGNRTLQMYFLDAIGIFLFALPIALNIKGHYKAAKLAFLFGALTLFSLLCVVYGNVSGAVQLFMLGVVLPQFLIERKPIMTLFALMALGLFCFFEFYYFKHFKGTSEHTVKEWVYAVNCVLQFFLLYAIVKQFKYENEVYHALILQKNQELAQQKEEIEAQRDRIEEEKGKSESLLLNILPAETAQELKEKGFATPKHYELITVLFTDFKGFTQIAEKISPHEVIENLNICFLAFDEICDKYNLEKIKTIGDAYMCAGGLPVANTTNPIDVVSAGLEMQAWMTRWKQEKEARGELAWELRLGIHSGEAVAGVVGKNKFAYDVWGDTVNLASRMESSGEVGKVNISGTTYRLVQHRFACVYRGKIQAKNKGETEMYFVEGFL